MILTAYRLDFHFESDLDWSTRNFQVQFLATNDTDAIRRAADFVTNMDAYDWASANLNLADESRMGLETWENPEILKGEGRG